MCTTLRRVLTINKRVVLLAILVSMRESNLYVFGFEVYDGVLRNQLNAENVENNEPMQVDFSFQTNINTTDENGKKHKGLAFVPKR